MKFRLIGLIFLLISICLFYQSLFAFNQEIEITNADEVRTIDISTITNEVVNSSNDNFELPDGAIICHADEVWNYELPVIFSDAFYFPNANFEIPIEAAVCHADEVWGNELTKTEIGDEFSNNTKTPVLFVILPRVSLPASDRKV